MVVLLDSNLEFEDVDLAQPIKDPRECTARKFDLDTASLRNELQAADSIEDLATPIFSIPSTDLDACILQDASDNIKSFDPGRYARELAKAPEEARKTKMRYQPSVWAKNLPPEDRPRTLQESQVTIEDALRVELKTIRHYAQRVRELVGAFPFLGLLFYENKRSVELTTDPKLQATHGILLKVDELPDTTKSFPEFTEGRIEERVLNITCIPTEHGARQQYMIMKDPYEVFRDFCAQANLAYQTLRSPLARDRIKQPLSALARALTHPNTVCTADDPQYRVAIQAFMLALAGRYLATLSTRILSYTSHDIRRCNIAVALVQASREFRDQGEDYPDTATDANQYDIRANLLLSQARNQIAADCWMLGNNTLAAYVHENNRIDLSHVPNFNIAKSFQDPRPVAYNLARLLQEKGTSLYDGSMHGNISYAGSYSCFEAAARPLVR